MTEFAVALFLALVKLFDFYLVVLLSSNNINREQ